MGLSHPALAVGEVRWQPCFRVISSRYPPIHLFERVAAAEDWDALYWLESLTNSRLRDEVGEIELASWWIVCAASTWLKALKPMNAINATVHTSKAPV